MDLKSGKFTAPRPGIYFFSFMGLARFPVSSSSKVYLGVILYLNEGRIGTGYVTESNTVADQSSPLTVQSTLKLKKGDRVWVTIFYQSSIRASLSEKNINHHTHFTGFILEEEIVTSLWEFCFNYPKMIGIGNNFNQEIQKEKKNFIVSNLWGNSLKYNRIQNTKIVKGWIFS